MGFKSKFTTTYCSVTTNCNCLMVVFVVHSNTEYKSNSLIDNSDEQLEKFCRQKRIIHQSEQNFESAFLCVRAFVRRWHSLLYGLIRI